MERDDFIAYLAQLFAKDDPHQIREAVEELYHEAVGDEANIGLVLAEIEQRVNGARKRDGVLS